MKAKEMFEELGYKEDYPDDYDEIVYARDILNKDTFAYIDSEIISFYENKIWVTNKSDFDLEELQAINQQIKELGWLDE